MTTVVERAKAALAAATAIKEFAKLSGALPTDVEHLWLLTIVVGSLRRCVGHYDEGAHQMYLHDALASSERSQRIFAEAHPDLVPVVTEMVENLHRAFGQTP